MKLSDLADHSKGNVVRCMYACCGATDYYLETGDPAYLKTLTALSQDLVEHQLYITGGVGARAAGETFGNAYELPNARAYGESCAAIGNMMWNWRMLSATGNALHTDVMERALYNGINSGLSLDGKLYCYRNPLAFDPSSGDKIRNPWYDTTCCPPNLERTFASLPGYFYSTSKDGIYVHLYDNSELRWHLDSGNGIRITQQTKYPWEGKIALHVAPANPEEFTLFVRIPAWSKHSTVKVNGKPVDSVAPGTYQAIRRHWRGEEIVELEFDMRPQMVHANPAVTDDNGRVAMQRGPVVYCMEQLDQAGNTPEEFPLVAAHLAGANEAQYDPNLLDGVVYLKHPGMLSSSTLPTTLYQTGPISTKPGRNIELKLIPYYAWANRDPSAMQVWIPYV